MSTLSIEFSPAITNTRRPMRLDGVSLPQIEAMLAELEGAKRVLLNASRETAA